MFKKILVPYDGSKPADKATRYAMDLAKAISRNSYADDDVAGCEIILLHVVPEIPASPVFIERPMSTSKGEHIPLSEYVRRLYAEMKVHAAEMLEKKKKEIETFLENRGTTVRTVVIIGDPVANKIVEQAASENVDLIVIGNVGLSGVSKLKTLGSVSRGVSERAPCPVMIVH
ncbi:universal stress protein UspA-like protein [Candidatus Nitrososphaera evergladensis SR1]|uniref:Universal stress protein UspA-like protein n=1 Tax=Candidatus Nitrososphaera evergladensis SR1 TaxID=1459636 RepID=A0A075MUH2_9ARCH|nr:universal stress protein [Candidatus Nitrososphaera evergladensis]AIF82964.1 universal stress protein UspA-like protein [Candidatus Nitrososphaera evergladensis SR1]